MLARRILYNRIGGGRQGGGAEFVHQARLREVRAGRDNSRIRTRTALEAPMAISILIPTALRSYAGGGDTVTVEALTIGDALSSLVEKHPALKKHLFNDEG